MCFLGTESSRFGFILLPRAAQMKVRPAHRSKWSLRANSCQSLPLALAVSKVAQILWWMDAGILKALGPVCDVTVQSVCMKNGTASFSACGERNESRVFRF